MSKENSGRSAPVGRRKTGNGSRRGADLGAEAVVQVELLGQRQQTDLSLVVDTTLPFELAKFQALLLQFAPGPLKLTPDQVVLLRSDNVVSNTAKSADLTLEGLGITPDSLEAIAPQYLWRFRKSGQFQ